MVWERVPKKGVGTAFPPHYTPVYSSQLTSTSNI